ncbi:MAG: hypothetical protein Q4C13_02350, partial [Clostridia bacterium]|nr:hypothetical protein [Clostridia bacterium]
MLREAGDGDGLLKRLAARLRGNKKLEIALYGGIILTVLALYVSGLRQDRRESAGAEERAAQTS